MFVIVRICYFAESYNLSGETPPELQQEVGHIYMFILTASKYSYSEPINIYLKCSFHFVNQSPLITKLSQDNTNSHHLPANRDYFDFSNCIDYLFSLCGKAIRTWGPQVKNVGIQLVNKSSEVHAIPVSLCMRMFGLNYFMTIRMHAETRQRAILILRKSLELSAQRMSYSSQVCKFVCRIFFVCVRVYLLISFFGQVFTPPPEKFSFAKSEVKIT